MKEPSYTARWWKAAEADKVQCLVCPRQCVIGEGKAGFCAVRRNTGGKLYSVAYGYPVALQSDPIEKKPLMHYLPGTNVFSVGSLGCNLGCCFCQNDHLSRCAYKPRANYRYFEPSELVELTRKYGCESIAFTYNDPTVWAEYVIDTFKLAREAGLGTVLVTNGYIEKCVAEELYPLTDAANVDVKGFTDKFYGEMCSAKLQPVREACELLHKLGVHLEITNLIIPGKNSDPEQVDAMLDWIQDKLGRDTPLHFTSYHPAYRYHDSPRTPKAMLRDIWLHALERGFTRVYMGNILKREFFLSDD